MLDLPRRIAALTLLSAVGIAVLAPLVAADEPPAATGPQALINASGAHPALAPRGSLSQRDIALRGISAPAGMPAERLEPAALPTPASAVMEATLYEMATPAPPIVAPPPPAAPAPAASVAPFVLDASVWDRLAQCEASGNWAANTGNGYYGGLQFALPTWQGYGGAQFAAYPHEATREEQITVAERLHAARGFQPWPACRLKLGLP